MHSLDNSTAQQLVVLYHDALSALLDTPELFVTTLNHKVSEIIFGHGIVIVVEPDPHLPAEARTEPVAHIRLDKKKGTPADVQLRTVEPAEGGDLLEGLIAQANNDIVAAIETQYPGTIAHYIHWLRSMRSPKVAAAIFRVDRPNDLHGPFTEKELALIDAIEPHLLNCVHLYQEQTRTRRATFDFFAERCSALAASCSLTSTEERILRKMVEGVANKEISEDLGISLATVKTHISHILQKTGCRNRTDLIGKYFSSKHAVTAP